MFDSRCSENEVSRRDIPSFIEPRPPLISNPFMRPRPQKGTNLLELFEEDSDCEEPELVQVYLRLKPCNTASNLYEVRSDRCLITSLDTTTAGHGRRTQHNVSKMYTFSHIFGADSSQKEIFEHVVKENLQKLPEGNSFTLLTYGASGSGKTFTLMGTVASPGLVPRSLEYVFKIVDAAQRPLFKPSESGADKLSHAEQEYELQWVKRLRQVSAPSRDKYRRMSAQLFGDLTYSNLDLSNRNRHYLWVSFIEIYNEGIYDLLAPGDRRNAAKLAIREDSSGNVYVKGATQTFVRSGEEAYDIMVAGKHNLQVAATGIHAQSSRSHCIFTITMLTETPEGVGGACVRLCDLAGCERAARTRNTGARMHESRAINSSLHVLERCLRTLRRKRGTARAALVPYRESKLTRLLGAGLSGARGEAVSMVVTLNPSREYAHETRHVLQLAAVARDIQINNTLSDYPSTLESSTQDSSFNYNSEVIKLRTENERLHFELVQAQARNKELSAHMEQRQASAADTMRELVEEAKEISRQYYEEQMQALRAEMDEMAEEYENKLSSIKHTSSSETPSKILQNKITQLMTEIAILEENLTAERLARARAEEEVQHLRACIDERDEKADSQNPSNEDVMSVTDSDNSDDDEDPCNESLEPTFRKEDINRSRMLRQSFVNHTSFNSEHSEDVSALDKTGDTLKEEDEGNESHDNDCTYETSKDISVNRADSGCLNDPMSVSSDMLPDSKDLQEVKKSSRSTYFVEDKVNEIKDIPSTASTFSRATFSMSSADNSVSECSKDSDDQDDVKKSLGPDKLAKPDDKLLETVPDDTLELNKKSGIFVNKIISCNKKLSDGNNSLAQFESLELAANAFNSDMEQNVDDNYYSDFKVGNEKRNYFDEESTNLSPKTPATVVKSKEKKIYFNNIDIIRSNKKHIDIEGKNQTDDYRSPPIVKDEVTNDFEPTMIKKLLGESIARQAESISSVHKLKLTKKYDSIDMFEGLDSPQVFNEVKNTDNVNVNNVTSSIENHAMEDKAPLVAQTQIKVERKSETEIKEEPAMSEPSLVDEIIETLPEKLKVQEVSTDIATVDDKSISKEVNLLTNQEKGLEDAVNDESQLQINSTKVDNTIEEFENIYKDVSAPRETEFDLLISRDGQDTTADTTADTNTNNDETSETDELKYNLRHKSKIEKPKNEKRGKNKNTDEEVIMESLSKCESKPKPTKRNLRLRRRKNASEEEADLQKENKLKDIVNLQTEFSDVTMDIPAAIKQSKDIPSPERMADDENQPPMFGIQSCPSKSITRSRRKLFTPRAEPLEESLSQTGDSNERVYVPRPSYHRPRARRKL
ncbi:kinesin-like protein KIF20B [Vanessa cardui]|uniref:kinesin-like protein KIF20B n=1 Tax=Vanessa cardui TaxID=171605 RepID=UPI001F148F17|nr:kinesin-like protein KIF20B [Vanessa cardui]